MNCKVALDENANELTATEESGDDSQRHRDTPISRAPRRKGSKSPSLQSVLPPRVFSPRAGAKVAVSTSSVPSLLRPQQEFEQMPTQQSKDTGRASSSVFQSFQSGMKGRNIYTCDCY